MTSENKFTPEQLEKINTYYLTIGAITVILSYLPFKLNPSVVSMNLFTFVVLMYGAGVIVLMFNTLKLKKHSSDNDE